MSLAEIALSAGRRSAEDRAKDNKVVDIITFIEADWGLSFSLYPVQKFILKVYYGLPLEKYIPTIKMADNWRKENERLVTEFEYLGLLFEDGRINIDPDDYDRDHLGREKQEIVLSIGRRSGKTLISSFIVAYETYRLISKGDPHKYYGISKSANIQMISVATDKDQAGLLYQEVSGFYNNCDFYTQYMANNTLSYARFQTPRDIEKFGSYRENDKARASIKITFRSCIAKGLRGSGNIVVVLDEVAHFTDKGQSSADSVWDAVRPSISAFSPKNPKDKTKPIGPVESKMVLISSPLGKDGLFYDRFQVGFRGGDDLAARNMLCVEAPTWEVNPTVPPEEYETNYQTKPNVFFAEYGAKFSDRTAGWIQTEQDLLNCLSETLTRKMSGPTLLPHFLGLDLAQSGDASAAAIGHIENGKVVTDYVGQIKAGVGKYEGLTRLPFEAIVDWVWELSRRFFFEEGLFDQWYGIVFEQLLHKKGLIQLKMKNLTKAQNSEMARTFKVLMFSKRLVLYDPRGETDGVKYTYIEELLSLQAEKHSKYIITVEAPNDPEKHDDRSDALLRMVWLASQYLGNQKYTVGSSTVSHVTGRPGPSHQNIVRSRLKALRGGSNPARMLPLRRRW